MPIPYRLNPMGKNEKKYFELVVKPGILAADMTYGFTPYWNSGGYCKVDWGDGQKEDAVTSGTKLNHTYVEAGTYTVKIKAECYQVNFSDAASEVPIIAYCSGNWDALGYLTAVNCMFRNCSNMELDCTSLPEGLIRQLAMFASCSKSTLPLTSLPAGLTTGHNMFYRCTNAQLPLTSLPDGLTDGNSMFYNCSNAKLPLTSLPEGLTSGYHMFNGCTNAQLPLTKLPDGLTDGFLMFTGCTSAELPLTSLPEGLTDGSSMFNGCKNARLEITSLPEGLTNGGGMFHGCVNAKIALTKLPDGLTGCSQMFRGCTNLEVDLDTLTANAPAEGWTKVTSILYMFYGCPKVTGSRSAFLAKFPNVTNITDAFTGTNTTE